MLDQSERSVDALARAAGLNLTTASAHLQTLKPAGLVTTRRQGLRIHCRLAGTDVAGPYALLQQVAPLGLIWIGHCGYTCRRRRSGCGLANVGGVFFFVHHQHCAGGAACL
ncbi:helix-turn-helix domain-containing protein [Streptomyces sp. A30]|uniref:helix-turn-helix domain-containing protein n=1 Tax=Streptomyces sp. A30 TaxID=2789273 RepID=UPI00397FB214